MKDVLERTRRVAEKEARDLTDEELPPARRTRVRNLRGHAGPVQQACVLSRGDGIVTACGDTSVRVYSLSGGDPLHELDLHDDWATSVTSLDEDVVVSVGCDGKLVTWSTSTGKLIENCQIRDHDHQGGVVARVGWNQIVVGTGQGELHLISHTAGRGLRYVARLRRAHRRSVNAISWHEGLLVVGSNDRSASIWEGRKRIQLLPHDDSIRDVDIDDDRVLTLSDDEVRVYERGTWRLERVLRGLHGYEKVTSMVLLKNDVLLTTGHDANVLFTRISDAKPLARYETTLQYPDAVTIAPGGRLIVTSECEYGERGVVMKIDRVGEASLALRASCEEKFKLHRSRGRWWTRGLMPVVIAAGTAIGVMIARRTSRQQ